MKTTRVPYKAVMIRAILDGLKWQTRRIAHGEPAPGGYKVGDVLHGQGGKPIKSPYGLPGDLMVATEAWRVSLAYELTKPSEIPPGSPIFYEAGGGNLPEFNAGRLRPSMFMPAWASRISEPITDVRVERLQDISKADAIAEGLRQLPATGRWVAFPGAQHLGFASHDPRDVYFDLWEQINGPGSVDLNPHVWAYSFNNQRKKA